MLPRKGLTVIEKEKRRTNSEDIQEKHVVTEWNNFQVQRSTVVQSFHFTDEEQR